MLALTMAIVTPGWQTEADGSLKYLKPDGTYVTGWLTPG